MDTPTLRVGEYATHPLGGHRKTVDARRKKIVKKVEGIKSRIKI